MTRGQKSKRTGNVILPDWLGSGHDLFGTIQIIKGKSIQYGYLEMDFNFKFSDTFNYPIIFGIRSVDADIVAHAIAFRINGTIDPAQRAIEERVIAPKVCQTLKQHDFICFFADVVQNNIDFALYINKTPRRFKDIIIYALNDDQKLVLNERLLMKIAEVLDERV